jgi:hypothetical protein
VIVPVPERRRGMRCRLLRDRSAVPAVLLRSPVPGTAGNRRERRPTGPSVFAASRSCSRTFGVLEPVFVHRGDRVGLALLSRFAPYAVLLRSQFRAYAIEYVRMS